ncbi:MAG TPA: hypothetical protein VKW08_07860 [Xanthobacteraceae bacterium]|jgi:hypothetical protein|nr:hypothetical protein [Xanthobacteraceae bacterium]
MSNEQRPANQQQGARLVRATVARGRSILVPGAKKRVVGYAPADGKPIEVAELLSYGPGQEVELPADEVARLRVSGHLVDPHAAAVPLATDGPARAAA